MSKPKFDIIEEVITIELNGKEYEVDLARVSRLMMIDPAHLDEELQEQAAFFFWVATLATQAEVYAQDAKRDFDVFYSELVSHYREELADGGKAPAATVIEAEAKSDKKYNKHATALQDVQRIAALLKTVTEAVRMRQYTLIERSKRLSKNEAAEAEE